MIRVCVDNMADMGLIHISERFIRVKEGVIIINDVIIITYTSLMKALDECRKQTVREFIQIAQEK